MPAAEEAAEFVDALVRWRDDQPLPFTVHDDDDVDVFDSHPSHLYDRFKEEAASAGCLYFVVEGGLGLKWKVASGTEEVADGGGGVVAWKVTLAYHEGCGLGTTRWAMDEFTVFTSCKTMDEFAVFTSWKTLYRLRRLHVPEGQQEARRVGGFRRLRMLGN